MKILLRIVKWFLITVFSIVLVITLLNYSPWTYSSVPGTNVWRKTGEYPLIIPHGGAKDLAPENTVYAYEMLVDEFEADVLEIDLALTADNVLISHHDLDLEMSPASDFNGDFIRSYTYDEIIQEYEDDGYYLARQFVDIDNTKPFENENDPAIMEKMIPAKIEDIFNTVGDSVLYILEIKDSPTSEGYDEDLHDFELAAQTLIDLVEEYDLVENVVLASFSDDVTGYFKENMPEAKINAGTSEVTQFAIFSAFHIDFFWSVKSEVLILPDPGSMSITGGTAGILDILPGFFRDSIALKDDEGVYRANLMHTQIINDAHRKNMAVLYWTINDEETMRLLIANGADGIITDRPDILIEVINDLKGN